MSLNQAVGDGMKLRTLAIWTSLLFTSPVAVGAATLTVSTLADAAAAPVGSLRAALQNAASGDSIVFQQGLAGTINLAAPLPLISQNIQIDGIGASVTVSGQNQQRVFFVLSGTVSIANLNVAQGMAKGGDGGQGGGGGGLGAGGGLFVNAGAAVRLRNVQFTGNQAVGGSGGIRSPTTMPPPIFSGGGGGGLGGDGGAAFREAVVPQNTGFRTGGGGGGGITGDGGAGGARDMAGAPGAAEDGGGGGGGRNSAGAAGAGDAGDGGSSNGEAGGGGGGGGIGGANGSNNTASNGGPGGSGGFGGGGGGGGAGNFLNGPAADGGYGGGGGGAGTGLSQGTRPAGNGGFGGGGGGGSPSSGGMFGGNGNAGTFSTTRLGNSMADPTSGGGGGAGLGGAIFVREGGILVIEGVGVSGGAVNFGLGAGGSGNGQAFGTGLFLHDVSPIFEGTGTTTISDTIVGSGSSSLIVNGGTLAINGVAALPVTVNPGGTLGGIGQVGSTTVRGTLSPGNSIGTLTVDGPLTLAASNTLRTEIAPSGASDRVVVNGPAIVQGGTVQVVGGGQRFAGGQRFTILSATGSISGQFATVTDDLLGVEARLLYLGNDLLVELLLTPLARNALTFNQLSVARTFDLALPTATGDLATVFGALDRLPEPDLRLALEHIGGDIHERTSSVLLLDNTSLLSTIQRRLWGVTPVTGGDRRHTGAHTPGAGSKLAAAAPMSLLASVTSGSATGLTGTRRTTDGWSGWARGTVQGGDLDTDGNAAGLDFTTVGGTIGFDRDWDGEGAYGFLGAYADSDVNTRGRSDHSDIDSYRLGAYASRTRGDWYAMGAAVLSKYDFRTTRRIFFAGLDRTALSRSDGDGLATYLEVGKNTPWRGVSIRPHAAVSYQRVEQDGFTEDGAAALNLMVSENSTDALQGILGVWISKTHLNRHGLAVTPELRLRYVHDFQDARRDAVVALQGVPGTPFTIAGVRVRRDSGLVGLGMTAQVSDRLDAFVSYDGQFDSRQEIHTGEAGVRFCW